ncbi:MAG: D-alanyl-D-alanine carboxypeptidase [Candidatus Zixiibacteriota bacterium]|nr:MAG: D-alanyl-D-alanine carboxypeptidase [candidate division Zixibacteria bacterium]
MITRKTLPRVLLFLAAFVFFSANTIYMLEADTAYLRTAINKTYHFDFDHVREGPYLNLKSALLVNYDNGEVLYAKNADEVRPVASLTKLVTAMVILDKNIDMKLTEKIIKEDARRSSRSRLRVGYELTVRDLMHAMLMNSDNRAARALARLVSGSTARFAVEMNRKIKKLGLKNTVFFEPSGLDSRNVSTAHEIAKILHYAHDYDVIRQITAKKKYRVKVQNRKNTYLQMANTNLLIHSRYKVLSGKTGYIRAADYCLTSLIRNGQGENLTLVVLGAPGDRLRFKEARRLADWGFKQIG